MTRDRPGEPHGADFVVIDVETACSRVSSICQVGIVGFRDGREMFDWETLLDPCDDFHPMNTRMHNVLGQPPLPIVRFTTDRSIHLTAIFRRAKSCVHLIWTISSLPYWNAVKRLGRFPPRQTFTPRSRRLHERQLIAADRSQADRRLSPQAAAGQLSNRSTKRVM